MLQKVEITGVHTVPDDQIKDYLENCINKLERYIPKHARKSAHVNARLIESRAQGDKKCTAEVTMYLPHGAIVATESKQIMTEAIDLVEGKLVAQLKKYKETHADPHLLRKLSQRFRQA